mmetsp:Transcript_144402/g.402299  ORF Transcript_144402/g.402299 Transcript_144402/m.402299 type:complete len:108 (+) Transcript_144402:55-378(+)|eukprot:CAMPEP_0179091396 /NCGR_PEP_ID=MMETSP0796-20121207/41749_1 /TAXON_ID=73915 /ORGANISM="Pyrodinium bahamense, Strain pbaha01" /LENGTH=107 /DNA_ID=CAMNT_0020788987 /DNA_START=47 /DNA_END=370 /DNA_ORIENTATION=-
MSPSRVVLSGRCLCIGRCCCLPLDGMPLRGGALEDDLEVKKGSNGVSIDDVPLDDVPFPKRTRSRRWCLLGSVRSVVSLVLDASITLIEEAACQGDFAPLAHWTAMV